MICIEFINVLTKMQIKTVPKILKFNKGCSQGWSLGANEPHKNFG